jgi:AraC family transcriptional regulator
MPDLNKPATAGKAVVWGEKNGPPRWYLWEGGFLVVGQAGGEVPVHAHHAIQVFIAVEGKAAVRAAGEEWRETRALIVRPDIEHSFNAQGATGALLFVDPESSEGAWLQTSLTTDITLVPDARAEACVPALRAFLERPLESMEVGDLIRHCVRALCAGVPPTRRLEPRIASVLTAIQESDDLRISLEAAASKVHLSPGRFTHLFKDEVGLPFKRYMLWRKVTRAMLAMGRERTLAAAAQSGDFADAAHLTRTFHQMFGIPPSVFMRGEFFEIPSPFASSGARDIPDSA